MQVYETITICSLYIFIHKILYLASPRVCALSILSVAQGLCH